MEVDQTKSVQGWFPVSGRAEARSKKSGHTYQERSGRWKSPWSWKASRINHFKKKWASRERTVAVKSWNMVMLNQFYKKAQRCSLRWCNTIMPVMHTWILFKFKMWYIFSFHPDVLPTPLVFQIGDWTWNADNGKWSTSLRYLELTSQFKVAFLPWQWEKRKHKWWQALFTLYRFLIPKNHHEKEELETSPFRKEAVSELAGCLERSYSP